MNEYQQREHDLKLECIRELNLLSAYKFELKNENDNEVIRLAGDAPVYVRAKDYTGKYSFGLWYSLPFIQYETYKAEAAKHTQPNLIGVLSGKKIGAWVEYLTAIYTRLEIISQEREQAVNIFLAEMREAGAVLNEEHKTGQLEKNGLIFTFEIHKEGYISKNIEVSYAVNDTLENFTRLADNKYQK